MADRFPLIVNETSRKIEEMVSGDNLDLTGNGIAIEGSTGSTGQYLRTNGTTVEWGSPGNVYLTQTQTITNKTFETCSLSGSSNIFTNIPNSALVNSAITVNGVSIPLGGSVTTPDNNTTYSISTQDATSSSEKIIRLTSGGGGGAGVNDDIKIAVGSPLTVPSGSNPLSLFISRSDDTITISGHVVDNDTITTLVASGGAPQTGAISFTSTGSATVTMTGSTINIDAVNTDTITSLRVGTGQTLASGNFTFLDDGATTVSQGVDGNGDATITIESTDTVTRLRGGTTGTFTPAVSGTSTTDITITGGSSGNVTVSQSGNTINIDSIDTNTVTRLAANTETLGSGDFRFTASNAAVLTQSTTGGVTTINISATDTNTTYSSSTTGGIAQSGTVFSLKNSGNFTGNRVLKWDSGNSQIINSIITDDGSSVTINGDLIVSGTSTTINTATLSVADNEVELRRGSSLVGFDGGIKLNRTTNNVGSTLTYTSLQWFEAGGYWRTYDGSIAHRLVTENETQILTNKTLTSPTLTSPTLGIATATTINGLAITSTVNGTLNIVSNKTFRVNNTITLSANNDTSTVNFRLGGNVAYTADTLAVFANTTSTQLRGIITDSTGGGSAVFNSNPNFATSIGTTDTGLFSVFNTAATTINAFGAATSINLGATTGTTLIRHNLTVNGNVTLGDNAGDTVSITGLVDFVNEDIVIRGSTSFPMKIGRGGNALGSNTTVGYNSLTVNSGGVQNCMFGFETGSANISGTTNNAFGYRALKNSTVGDDNNAFGKDALLNNLSGDKNIAVGTSTLSELQIGNSNVCIGHFAGYNCLGSGNVLIGPADDQNSTNATYEPPSVSGDRQLVIGSGTGTWIRGDNNFDVTTPNNFNVGGNIIISGNLTVNGSTTTINTSVLSVDDKAIEIGAVVNTNFAGTVTNNSATITNVSPVGGLIPGMEVSVITNNISVPAGTVINSITGTTMVLSSVVTILGASTSTATLTATGPSDVSADNGGIILKGTTDKKITWSDATDAWTSTEHIDLATGKQYRIGNVLIASGTQIGPSTGTFSLGAGVTTSSLTSVGTLTSLAMGGNITMSDNNKLIIGTGGDLEIFHDGTTTFINDVGTGALSIRGSQVELKSIGGENMVIAVQNGAVELYHDNSKKFETTSTGVSVTGALSVSGNIETTGSNTSFRSSSTSSGDYVRLYAGGGTAQWDIYGNGENLRMGDNSSSATAKVQFDNPTLHRSTATTNGVAALTAKQEVNNGGYLIFDGKNSSDTTVFSVTHNGRVLVSDGIDFSANSNAAGMTSELLNDYEEGTWTPSITGFTNGGTITGRAKDYIKIGKQVTVWFDIFQNSNNMSFADGATITGLPFATNSISAGDQFHTQVNLQYYRGGGQIVHITAYVETSDTIVIRGASADSDIRHIWGHVTYITT